MGRPKASDYQEEIEKAAHFKLQGAHFSGVAELLRFAGIPEEFCHEKKYKMRLQRAFNKLQEQQPQPPVASLSVPKEANCAVSAITEPPSQLKAPPPAAAPRPMLETSLSATVTTSNSSSRGKGSTKTVARRSSKQLLRLTAAREKEKKNEDEAMQAATMMYYDKKDTLSSQQVATIRTWRNLQNIG
jgi:hypothetical protein